MITAAPLRAAKKPKVSSASAPSAKREEVEAQPASVHDGQALGAAPKGQLWRRRASAGSSFGPSWV